MGRTTQVPGACGIRGGVCPSRGPAPAVKKLKSNYYMDSPNVMSAAQGVEPCQVPTTGRRLAFPPSRAGATGKSRPFVNGNSPLLIMESALCPPTDPIGCVTHGGTAVPHPHGGLIFEKSFDGRLRYQPVTGAIPLRPCNDHGKVTAFLLSARSLRQSHPTRQRTRFFVGSPESNRGWSRPLLPVAPRAFARAGTRCIC